MFGMLGLPGSAEPIESFDEDAENRNKAESEAKPPPPPPKKVVEEEERVNTYVLIYVSMTSPRNS
jgi:hypothetical protein